MRISDWSSDVCSSDLIGNTGINDEDVESSRIHAAGLVVRDCPPRVSNFRATRSLPDYLKSEGVVAIAGVDTRKLTRILRSEERREGKECVCRCRSRWSPYH